MRHRHTTLITRLLAFILLSEMLLVAKPQIAAADTLYDLYGTSYDRAAVIEEGSAEADLGDETAYDWEFSDEASIRSDAESAEDEIALTAELTSTYSISPRAISSEMLYFCTWESGINYDQGLSYGDDYNALGCFQFDHRYDLGSFLQAVYNYNPSKYSVLSIIGSRYNWDVRGYTRNGDSFTQLGNDLNDVWHACYNADPTEFSQLQNDWAYTQYFDGITGIRGSLRAMGINIDNRSDSVKSLVWGMSNLFGQGGGSSYVAKGLYYGANWFIKNSGVNDAMDDVTFVSVLCDYVINNVAQRYSSQPQYWQGWPNRYRDEKAHYLSVIKRWVYIDSRWYLQIASTGEKVKGWAYVDNAWYYLDPDTGAMQTGWLQLDSTWYWLDPSGVMRTGWQVINGSWYWFDSSGAMKTGWLLQNSAWYWLDSSGAMKTGWQLINGAWYWFSSSGVMKTGWLQLGSTWYRLDSSGVMCTGWQAINGSWYWFDKSNGAMAAERTLTDGLWSDFNSSGSWSGYSNGWDNRGEAWYWLENGTRASGWRYIGSTWYWLDKETNKAAQNTIATINSAPYAFNSDRGMVQNNWCLVDGKWYWASSSGVLSTGWQLIHSRWYWFDKTSYAMQTGWLQVGSTWYWLDSSGFMKTGWLQLGSTWYWFDASGAMKTGWQYVNGAWYWFNSSGSMQTGWLLLGSTWYWFDSSGAMRTGWQLINGSWYYFDSSGAMRSSEWVGSYYLDADGRWATNANNAS